MEMIYEYCGLAHFDRVDSAGHSANVAAPTHNRGVDVATAAYRLGSSGLCHSS